MFRTIFALMLSYSAFASASTLGSDFAFLFKNGDFINMIETSDSVEVSKKLGDLNVDSPFKTSIKNINFKSNLSYSLKTPDSWWSELEFNAKANNFEITLGEVTTKDTVVTRRGNITLRTRIEATCKNIKIQAQSRDLGLNGLIQFVNGAGYIAPRLKLSSIDLIDKEQWSINTRHCEGFKNYKEELANSIRNWLTENSEINALLQSELQLELKANIKDQLSKALLPQYLELPLSGRVTVIPDYLQLLPNGRDFAIFGRIYSQFYSPDNPYQFDGYRPNLATINQMNSSGMIISKEFLRKMSSQFHKNGVFQIDFESQKIPGLKELHESRFAQFFVFPDLMNFSRDANFIMKTFLLSDPGVKITAEGNSVQIEANGQAHMDNYVPKENGYVLQTQFKSNYRVKAQIRVINQELRVNFLEPEMDLSYTWNPKYIENYDPNTNISEDRIKDELSTVIQELSFKTQLPKIQIGPSQNRKDQLESHTIESIDDFVFITYKQNQNDPFSSGRK